MEEKVENREKHKCISLNIIKKVNKEWGDIESTRETFKAVKKISEAWMEEEEKLHVVDKQDNKIHINAIWSCGVRTKGRYNKDNKT